KNMSKTHESAVVSYSSEESIDARMQIFGLMNAYQASDEEKERSLGLFLRGSLLARILAIADIYKLIVDIPGAIFDVGTWRGQTASCARTCAPYSSPCTLVAASSASTPSRDTRGSPTRTRRRSCIATAPT